MARYKFRVTYREHAYQTENAPVAVLKFYRLRDAKRVYRDILLGYYRKRYQQPWEICLNHVRDPQWQAPMHYECSQMLSRPKTTPCN